MKHAQQTAAFRQVYWIPSDAFVEGKGWRVSIVREGESGHYPTGAWPYDPTKPLPYFWGDDYERAIEACYAANLRNGISREDTLKIVASSVAASSFERRRGL